MKALKRRGSIVLIAIGLTLAASYNCYGRSDFDGIWLALPVTEEKPPPPSPFPTPPKEINFFFVHSNTGGNAAVVFAIGPTIKKIGIGFSDSAKAFVGFLEGERFSGNLIEVETKDFIVSESRLLTIDFSFRKATIKGFFREGEFTLQKMDY